MTKLGLVVRRVTEAQTDDGMLTAVRFAYAGEAPNKKKVAPEGALLFVQGLSFVYPGPARHRVGDSVSIAIIEEHNVQ